MLIALTASKDAYITDRVIGGSRRHGANTGQAGTLDLFKLYGATFSGSVPNIELSRLLVKFDLGPIARAAAAGTCDVGHSSFRATMRLAAAVGGQPCPPPFTAVVHPLSATWDEGLGRDVALYGDGHVANFLTSSFAGGVWVGSGASVRGAAGQTCDAIESVGSTRVWAEAGFSTGEEDLIVDVTRAVSATVAGLLGDHGFRVAFTGSIEADTATWFVKRFFSRHASDPRVRPSVTVGWDSSRNDDSGDVRFGTQARISFDNVAYGRASNFVSGAFPVTGTGCAVLKLVTPVSGGFSTASFTGSQVSAPRPVTGSYYADCTIQLNDQLRVQLAKSGSVTYRSYWESIDGTVGYATGSNVVVTLAGRGGTPVPVANLTGIPGRCRADETIFARCFLDAYGDRDPAGVSRLPKRRPTAVRHDIHFRVRDDSTGGVVVPVDELTNSTKMSNDYDGYYFRVPLTACPVGKPCSIEVVMYDGSSQTTLPGGSAKFVVVGP